MILEIIVTILKFIIAPALLFFIKKWVDVRKKNKELLKLKTQRDDRENVLNRLIDFRSFDKIKKAVDRIFKETKAKRFLILVTNTKEDEPYDEVSVIFEQQGVKTTISAISRYSHLKIDDEYRAMLNETIRYGRVELETAKMPTSLLKTIYTMSKVTFSNVELLGVLKPSKDSELTCFSSIATYNKLPFTDAEKIVIQTEYDSTIRPTINDILN